MSMVCLPGFLPDRSLALWLRPAHATGPGLPQPNADNIKVFCENRPGFSRSSGPLRTALVAKCEGEESRRYGLAPFSVGVVPPVESAKKPDPFSAGDIPPVESAKKPDPFSAGDIPPVESAKK